MQKLLAAAVCLVLGLAASARATIYSVNASAGNYSMTTNSTLTVPLYVTDSGNAATQDIEGMTLTLKLGTGAGTAPIISAINFATGPSGNTIWDPYLTDYNSDVTVSSGVGGEYISYSVLTDNAGDYANANGIFAYVTFNSAGASAASYPLSFVSGNDTFFTDGQGNTVSSTNFTAGALLVTPVPEPVSASFLAVATIGLMVRPRRTGAPRRA